MDVDMTLGGGGVGPFQGITPGMLLDESQSFEVREAEVVTATVFLEALQTYYLSGIVPDIRPGWKDLSALLACDEKFSEVPVTAYIAALKRHKEGNTKPWSILAMDTGVIIVRYVKS
jgi:hypothetical protein